jgi:hypothetical protein
MTDQFPAPLATLDHVSLEFVTDFTAIVIRLGALETRVLLPRQAESRLAEDAEPGAAPVLPGVLGRGQQTALA